MTTTPDDIPALLAACTEWDTRLSDARQRGIPVSEADCNESARVKGMLRIEMRRVAKSNEGSR